MNRKKFIKNLGLAGVFPLIPADFHPNLAENNQSLKDIILPKALQKGDTIGIVSPASAIFESEPYEIAQETFEAMGLKVKFGKHVNARYGHLAGTDEERAGDLNAMFKDPSVNAIIALRGGSGSARILDKLDYETIKNNPKIFIGYSDITAIHLAIFQMTGLVTFHGPVAVSSWNGFSRESFEKLLFGKEKLLYENPSITPENQLVQTENRIRTITPGTAKGRLLGGNLSVLTGIMGSPYFPTDWSDKILYLEDVGEQIYAIDRMFSQLELGGVFKQIKGFIFGKCNDCDAGGSGYGSLTLEEVIDHYIKPLGIPAFSGAMFGHVADNTTIPNGIETEVDAEKGTFQLLSAAVR
ncbi:MAG TPA: LD-carboxypeptidase [Leeuwenhoekiella sp.]|nr:LD-carboxypeptidase [Leeuwenhoekiella sp.]